MAVFLVYLVKSTICLTVFSVFFRLLLTKETFFRITRIALISGLVVYSILPFVKIRTNHTYSLQQPVFQLEERLLSEKTVRGNNTDATITENLTPTADDQMAIHPATDENNAKNMPRYTIVIIVYWIGFSFMIVRFAISLIRICQLISKSRLIKSDGYTLVVTSKDVVAFSFFRYIVLSEKDYTDNPDEIILHEQMHMRRRHNLDIVFSELFLTLHWFNPMVWLLSRDLREIHEYEADNAVIRKGIDTTKYQLLLVKKAVGERRFTSVVNSFNQSKIKNRITMMLKKESTRWAQLKVLFVVPLAAVMLAAFAQPAVEKKTSDILQQDNPESVVKQVQSDPYFYWNQVQEYCEKKGIDPKNMNLKDIAARKHLVVMLINSKNQVLYENGSSTEWFKTLEESKSDASVQALKKMIVETMVKSEDNPIFFTFQSDKSASTNFVVHLINTTLPKAYEAALQEVSVKTNTTVNQLKKEKPLLLLYADPKTYTGNANNEVRSKEEISETFTINTSTEKNGKEETSFWKVIRKNTGNDTQTVTIRQQILSGSEVIEEKSSSPSMFSPTDIALIGVGTDMTQVDINGLKTHILDKGFKAKEVYFILSM